MIKKLLLCLILQGFSLSFMAFPLHAKGPQANRARPNSNQFQPVYDKSSWKILHDLVFIHTIPKCGTHFILQTMSMMTGKKTLCHLISPQEFPGLCKQNILPVTFQPYNYTNLMLAIQSQHKVIAMIRDPRDALISLLFHMRKLADPQKINNTRRDFFTVVPNFDSLSLDEQITSLILGDRQAPSYLQFYKERIGWSLHHRHLMVKFEDLVGEQGGSDQETQRATLLKIAHYIHLDLTPERLDWLADHIYERRPNNERGGNTIFKRSSIGNWKTFLSEEHKNLIKQELGEEIILLGYESNLDW